LLQTWWMGSCPAGPSLDALMTMGNSAIADERRGLSVR
jgi:hypothetical protein